MLTDERFSNYHWNPDDKINKTTFRNFFSLTFFVRRNFSVQLHLCLVCICAIIFFLSAVLMLIPRWLRFIYCLLFAFQVLCVSLRNYRIPGTQAMCIQFKHNGHPILRNGIIRKRSNKQTTFGSRDKTRKAASQRRRKKNLRTEMNMTKNTNLIHNFNFYVIRSPFIKKRNDKARKQWQKQQQQQSSFISLTRTGKVSKATQSQMFMLAYLIFALFFVRFPVFFRSYRLINFHTYISSLRGAASEKFHFKMSKKLFIALSSPSPPHSCLPS